MDGTIFDSTAAVVHHWTRIANELQITPESILSTSHGRRTIDILRLHAPHLANETYVRHVESLIPKLYAADATVLPGSAALINTLTASHAPWAIVTSGTSVLVGSWMAAMDLPLPSHLVTADDVTNGKPDPECYRLGLAKVFGVPATDEGLATLQAGKVVVLEDAPAGIRAGKAAGCTVIALLTTHSREQAVEAGADWIVKDLSCVRAVKSGEDGVHLEITGERRPLPRQLDVQVNVLLPQLPHLGRLGLALVVAELQHAADDVKVRLRVRLQPHGVLLQVRVLFDDGLRGDQRRARDQARGDGRRRLAVEVLRRGEGRQQGEAAGQDGVKVDIVEPFVEYDIVDNVVRHARVLAVADEVQRDVLGPLAGRVGFLVDVFVRRLAVLRGRLEEAGEPLEDHLVVAALLPKVTLQAEAQVVVVRDGRQLHGEDGDEVPDERLVAFLAHDLPFLQALLEQVLGRVRAQGDELDAVGTHPGAQRLLEVVLLEPPAVGVVDEAEDVRAVVLEQLGHVVLEVADVKLARGREHNVRDRLVLVPAAKVVHGARVGDRIGQVEGAHDVVRAVPREPLEKGELDRRYLAPGVDEGGDDLIVGAAGLEQGYPQRPVLGEYLLDRAARHRREARRPAGGLVDEGAGEEKGGEGEDEEDANAASHDVGGRVTRWRDD
ncbi:2-deoxyglucose-6-phosphate phosphatase [Drechslerella dactyloides]|uniref:2-deoxyglucose-6-phosphate phosphatase n=1 Tax=Drechslerella dactyloides TaxID=74499 RepID=A0AAD6IXP3_DREDA|nr:2-deoxyglucose-6-phosphate phosphatase [Drechslerella dactyloides]